MHPQNVLLSAVWSLNACTVSRSESRKRVDLARLISDTQPIPVGLDSLVSAPRLHLLLLVLALQLPARRLALAPLPQLAGWALRGGDCC